MLSLLADASQIKPPEGFTSFLECVMYVVVSAASVRHFLAAGKKPGTQQSEITNSPLQVEKAKSFTTTEEFAVLKAQVAVLSAKLDDDYRKLMEAGARREASIKDSIHTMKDHIADKLDQSLKESYHRINEHEKRISHTEGRLGIIHPPTD